ncbi:MAG: hypothetical protein LBW85_14525, partial [Deltaproteobacteria bacterium]|nr:hypothetical protein [Deltaproteobacteria bacterium]
AKKAAAAMSAAEFELNLWKAMPLQIAARKAWAAAREAAGQARAAARAGAVDTLKARAEAEEYMREFSQRDSGAARQKPEPELDMNKPAGN